MTVFGRSKVVSIHIDRLSLPQLSENKCRHNSSASILSLVYCQTARIMLITEHFHIDVSLLVLIPLYRNIIYEQNLTAFHTEIIARDTVLIYCITNIILGLGFGSIFNYILYVAHSLPPPSDWPIECRLRVKCILMPSF